MLGSTDNWTHKFRLSVIHELREASCSFEITLKRLLRSVAWARVTSSLTQFAEKLFISLKPTCSESGSSWLGCDYCVIMWCRKPLMSKETNWTLENSLTHVKIDNPGPWLCRAQEPRCWRADFLHEKNTLLSKPYGKYWILTGVIESHFQLWTLRATWFPPGEEYLLIEMMPSHSVCFGVMDLSEYKIHGQRDNWILRILLISLPYRLIPPQASYVHFKCKEAKGECIEWEWQLFGRSVFGEAGAAMQGGVLLVNCSAHLKRSVSLHTAICSSGPSGIETSPCSEIRLCEEVTMFTSE